MCALAVVAAPEDDDIDSSTPVSGWPEEQLWQRVRAQCDAAAREELINRYRPFARVVAATYYGRRIDDDIAFDDYHQCALVAMIESLDRFDPARGVQFKTFASRRMHGGILDGIESATEKQRQIAMRRRLRDERVVSELKSVQDATVASLGGVDEIFRVLAEVGLGLAVGLMLEDSGMIAAAPGAQGPDHAYAYAEQRQLTASIQRAVMLLSEQEQAVIRGHYMEDQLFGDIALKMGLTKGRISQVHRQALEKLRRLVRPGGGLDVAL